MWDSLTPQPAPTGMDALDKLIEGQKKPYERIAEHASAGGGAKLDDKLSFGNLDSREQRLAFMEKWNQGATGDISGPSACGPAALLAGAVYAGGGQGVSTLIDAFEAMRKKGGPVDDKTAEEWKKLDALKEKIAEHGELSAADMSMVQRDLYATVATGKNGEPLDGTSRDRVMELFKTSPALKKMFDKAEVRYETLDVNGTGQGGHAVLGIGKSKDGTHKAVYDPWQRINPDREARLRTQHADEVAADADAAARRGGSTKEGTEELALEKQHLDEAARQAHADQDAKEQAPQLITDPGLLHDYAQSTPYWIDDKSHVSARESPYRGMY
jgi:hypothetical protein